MTDMWVKNVPLKVGHTLTVTGIPTAGAARFVLDIHCGCDIALHISVQFGSGVICNSQQAGVWGKEVRQGGFPFKYNELFKFTVCLTDEEFLVVLSDASEIHFPNRLGKTEYVDFRFTEGVHVCSFEIN